LRISEKKSVLRPNSGKKKTNKGVACGIAGRTSRLEETGALKILHLGINVEFLIRPSDAVSVRGALARVLDGDDAPVFSLAVVGRSQAVVIEIVEMQAFLFCESSALP
jgi:hypothetical protein